MSPGTNRAPLPALELRCGGLHLTIQRIPGWLIGLITTAGAAATWWTTH